MAVAAPTRRTGQTWRQPAPAGGVTDFADGFNRPGPAVGNGWTVDATAGAPAIVAGRVTAGTVPGGPNSAYEISRELDVAPASFVEIGDVSHTGIGPFTHVFCGVAAGGLGAGWTGISASVGDSTTINRFRIWTWAAGVATQQALGAGSVAAEGSWRLEKHGNVYTGLFDGVPVVTWTGAAQWGRWVDVLTGGFNGFANNFDDYSCDGGYLAGGGHLFSSPWRRTTRTV